MKMNGALPPILALLVDKHRPTKTAETPSEQTYEPPAYPFIRARMVIEGVTFAP
jgi:hypothetical protein